MAVIFIIAGIAIVFAILGTSATNAEATDAISSKSDLHLMKVGIDASASAAEFGPLTVGRASKSNLSDTINVRAVENIPLTQLIPHNEYGNILFSTGSNMTLQDATLLSTLSMGQI